MFGDFQPFPIGKELVHHLIEATAKFMDVWGSSYVYEHKIALAKTNSTSWHPQRKAACSIDRETFTVVDIGVFLNGGTPNLHPKMIIFSRKTHGCLVAPF